MRLRDFNVLAGLFLPMLGKCHIVVRVEFASRVVRNVGESLLFCGGGLVIVRRASRESEGEKCNGCNGKFFEIHVKNLFLFKCFCCFFERNALSEMDQRSYYAVLRAFGDVLSSI
jgi:hypothetical protein